LSLEVDYSSFDLQTLSLEVDYSSFDLKSLSLEVNYSSFDLKSLTRTDVIFRRLGGFAPRSSFTH
jgi:hypothetical protein